MAKQRSALIKLFNPRSKNPRSPVATLRVTGRSAKAAKAAAQRVVKKHLKNVEIGKSARQRATASHKFRKGR